MVLKWLKFLFYSEDCKAALMEEYGITGSLLGLISELHRRKPQQSQASLLHFNWVPME